MYTVFGAGSVGTVLAAVLADSGIDVALGGRRAVPRLRVEGDVEEIHAEVPVVEEPVGTILLCVHEPDVPALAARWSGRRIISFANGVVEVDGVAPAVWRMTCTLLEPGFARFTRRGRIILRERDADVADDLSGAGFDVGRSRDIAADRWLKLFLNLTSAPNALIRKQDHGGEAFGAVKAELLEEARELLLRAGIDTRSCDGRDASPEEEIVRQRTGGGRARPVYNSIWRQLSLGRTPKERYHDVVARLGPAPKNEAMLRLLDAARKPECYSADEVLDALRGHGPHSMNACVIFDLDDTLIDTRNVLLPLAMERVSRAIGVPVDRLNHRGKKIDELLAPVEGLSEEQRAKAAAAWYKPEVPPLEPLPGARELLKRLRGRVRLFLLTRGDPARQRAKIAQCGLGPYFEDVVIRSMETPGTKRDDIEAILGRTQIPPSRCAVVGDDPADELRFAQELGCTAIQVPETPLSEVAETLILGGLLSVS